MAIVNYTKVETGWPSPMVLLFEWAAMKQGDTGAPVRLPYNADIGVQVVGGDITSTTIAWEGTLESKAVPTVYGTLHKVDGTALVQSVVGTIDQVLERALQYRPDITSGGASTSVTVRLIATKQWKD
jgi:hypothetical protein